MYCKAPTGSQILFYIRTGNFWTEGLYWGDLGLWWLWYKSAKKEVHSSVYQNLRLVLVFYPASMYLFKVNNGNTRIICEILQRHYNDFNNGTTRTISKMYSKLTVKTPERGQIRCSGVFIVNFKQISHIALVLPLLNLNK